MVQLVIAGQAITLALLGLLGSWVGKVKKDAAEARTNSAAARVQVENDHDTNLREENDSRHAETKRWMEDLRRTVTGQFKSVQRDIGGIRQELRDDRRANHDNHQATTEQIQDLADRMTNLEHKKESP